jgi:hypothetical protein
MDLGGVVVGRKDVLVHVADSQSLSVIGQIMA